jgi:hypothetical protein
MEVGVTSGLLWRKLIPPPVHEHEEEESDHIHKMSVPNRHLEPQTTIRSKGKSYGSSDRESQEQSSNNHVQTMKASSNIEPSPEHTVSNSKARNIILYPLKKSEIDPQQNSNKSRKNSIHTSNQSMMSPSNTHTTPQQY